MPYSYKPIKADLACLAFLLLAGLFLLCRHAAAIAMNHDGFLLTYWLQRGALPWMSFLYSPDYPAKVPGRPFVGLPWRLAAVISGGSATGYNGFQFVMLTLSAMLAYLVFRLVIPGNRAWALAFAALKLVWSSNVQLFANHSLHIYFTETVLWLAILLFAASLRIQQPAARLQTVLRIGMGCALYVVIGSYETTWPLVFLVPAIALALRFQRPLPASAPWTVVIWYGATLLGIATYAAAIVFSPLVHDQLIHKTTVDTLSLAPRIINGLGIIFTTSFVVPLQDGYRWLGGDRSGLLGLSTPADAWLCLLLSLCFLLLLVWGGSADRMAASGNRRLGLALAGTGVVVMFTSMLPPSVQHEILRGRLIHFAVIGTAMAVLGIAMLLVQLGKTGSVAATAALTILFAAHVFRLDLLAKNESNIGLLRRSFFSQIAATVPAVKEGTIVVLENPPPFFKLTDHFSSLVLRGFTRTRSTYFLSEYQAETAAGGRMLSVRTDIPLAEPDRSEYADLQYPQVGNVTDYQVERSRVIRLIWREAGNRVELAEPGADQGKILPGESAYGIRLFGATAGPHP